jgi:mannose-6-phosphate isomerase-like protein (cupin superfamily)
MNWSRRDLALLIPALASAQSMPKPETSGSKTYSFEDLPVHTSATGASRAIMTGATHSGYPVDMHESELKPGAAPHAPHHHLHEEIVFLREGTLEVTIMDRVTRIGPGSVAYFASNEEHGFRNVGTTTAQYFVLALGGDKA